MKEALGENPEEPHTVHDLYSLLEKHYHLGDFFARETVNSFRPTLIEVMVTSEKYFGFLLGFNINSIEETFTAEIDLKNTNEEGLRIVNLDSLENVKWEIIPKKD